MKEKDCLKEQRKFELISQVENVKWDSVNAKNGHS